MIHVFHHQLVAQTQNKEVVTDGDDGIGKSNDEKSKRIGNDQCTETPTRKVKPCKRKLKRTIKDSESSGSDRKRSKIDFQS